MAQKDFSSQKDKVQKALDKLDSQVTALRNKLSNLNREEGQKVKTLQLEISKLTNEISKRKVKESLSRDVEGCLDCPVCLDVCKPPTQEGAGLSLITRQLEDDLEEGYRATLREVKASNGKQQSPAGE